MSTKTKRVLPPSVTVYFTGRDKSLHRKLEALAKKHGMSSSTIGALAIRLGLPLVRKNLEGLLFDIGFQASENEKGVSTFVEQDRQ